MNTAFSIQRTSFNKRKTGDIPFFPSLVVLVYLLLNPPHINAQVLELSSGDRQVTLVELYTSEGCSSCPPADSWLRQYKNSEQLWQTIVPIAWHVDYWDYIGWKDPFASAKNSNRQRKLRRAKQSKSVYTPQFVVQGKEWRGYFSRAALPARSIKVPHNRLNFRLSRNKQNNNFTADYSVINNNNKKLPLPKSSNIAEKSAYDLHIALLAMNVKQVIKAGENHGKTLRHDFVVLAHKRFGAEQYNNETLGASNTHRWQGNLPALSNQTQAIAIWVTARNSEVPLQATGGYL